MAIRVTQPLLRTQVRSLMRSAALLVSKEKIDDILHTKTALQRRISGVEIPKAKYGGRHCATVLPGSGIGPELMCHIQEVFKFFGAPVDFEVIDIDPTEKGNQQLDYAITSIKRNGVGLKSNIESSSEKLGVKSRNVTLRNKLDLYVNVLHCKSYPGIPCRHKDIDIVLVRQNTDGEYAMLEHESVKGVVESLKIISIDNARRVARYAFEYAHQHKRKKVTTIHKANIMKLSDGLFLRCARDIAKEYPHIKHDDMIIDNTCLQLVSHPHQFDVMNMTNLYGNIVAQAMCGLMGGPGLISGANYGDSYAVFEPGTRHTASSAAGKNVANPVAMLNACVDMLQHLGHIEHAKVLNYAIHTTIVEDEIRTPDIGGECQTTDIIDNIMRILAEKPVLWPYRQVKKD